MAAISTNAIPAPAHAPANNAAKPGAHESAKSPADASPFAAILATANAPQQKAPQNDAASDDSQSDATDNSAPAENQNVPAGDNTQNSNSDATPQTGKDIKAQTAADVPVPVQTGKDGAATGKPAPKSPKTANDNKAADDGQVSQSPAPQPDPGAAPMAAMQLAAVQVQSPAANDDGDASDDVAPVAAKPARAAAPKPDTTPAPADIQSPSAAAQSAITGANSGNGKDAQDNDAKPQAAETKIADSKPSGEKPAAPAAAQAQAAPAPAAPTNIVATHSAPVQASTPDHPVTASVQVAPQADIQPNLHSLAVDIAARSQSGAKQFEIRLDPPELGRVDVRLSIDATGKAQAHLTADHPETLSLLQKDSSTLTQALRDSGLDVSQSGLNFSLRSQSDQAGNDRDNQGRSAARSSLAASRVLDAAQSTSSINFTAGNGRLDIHV